MQITGELVRAAHADAWQELARQRADIGGAEATLAGVRLMASGLPHPQWNNGDVHDPSAVDIAAICRWYADRGVRRGQWGLRVPAGVSWPHGRKLFELRLMAMPVDALAGVDAPVGVTLRAAGPADLDAVVRVDAAAFEAVEDVNRAWLAPMLSRPSIAVVLAADDGVAVGTGYAVIADGLAGPAVSLWGIGVVPTARRRGIGAAISTWLVDYGASRGARLAHLHPATEHAAGVYRRLGFSEVEGLDVYTEIG